MIILSENKDREIMVSRRKFGGDDKDTFFISQNSIVCRYMITEHGKRIVITNQRRGSCDQISIMKVYIPKLIEILNKIMEEELENV